jgi:hypothetical protein
MSSTVAIVVVSAWLGFFFIVGFIMYRLWKVTKERIEKIKEYALANNFKYEENVSSEVLRSFNYPAFQNKGTILGVYMKSKMVRYLIQGKKLERSFAILDYSYTERSGKHSSTITQTIFIINLSKKIPSFILESSSGFKKLTAYFKQGYLDFSEDPAFNKAYIVDGGDNVHSFFNAAKRAELVQNPIDYSVCSDGSRIAFFRNRQTLNADNFDTEIDKILAIAKILEK